MIAQINNRMDEDAEDMTNKILNPVCEITKPGFSNSNTPKTVTFSGKVFVQGDFAHEATEKLFTRRGFTLAESIEDADVVAWTGGMDINPAIYGQKSAGSHGFSTKRDSDDLAAVKKARGKFLVGICRGAQLLNCVPNGGTLWQDVNGHGSRDHTTTDVITGISYVINSLHHQQLKLTDKAELVAFSTVSTYKKDAFGTWHGTDGVENKDVEAAWYPETRSLLVQWHPEFGSSKCESDEYFYELLERYYLAS